MFDEIEKNYSEITNRATLELRTGHITFGFKFKVTPEFSLENFACANFNKFEKVSK